MDYQFLGRFPDYDLFLCDEGIMQRFTRKFGVSDKIYYIAPEDVSILTEYIAEYANTDPIQAESIRHYLEDQFLV